MRRIVLFSLLLFAACPRPAPKEPATQPAPAVPGWREALSPAPYVEALDELKQAEYADLLAERVSPCREAETLQASVSAGRCPDALRSAATAARLLARGSSRQAIDEALTQGFMGPRLAPPIESSPRLGEAAAPLALVEFADFECPHCARLAPILEALVQERPQELRLHFKFYPIPERHPNAQDAAEAAAFAQVYGKFWELHTALFANQRALSREGILDLAAAEGLDRAALEEALRRGTYRERVQRDAQDGDQAGLDGTPFLLIDGRPYVEGISREALARALQEAEIARRASCDSAGCR